MFDDVQAVVGGDSFGGIGGVGDVVGADGGLASATGAAGPVVLLAMECPPSELVGCRRAEAARWSPSVMMKRVCLR